MPPETQAVFDVGEADFQDAGARAVARAAGGRGLLGRLVRAVQGAVAGAGEGGHLPRRAGSSSPRWTSTRTRGSRRASASRAFPPSRRSATGRWSPSSAGRSRRPRSSASSTACSHPRPTSWPQRADEESLRRALELEPRHAEAAPCARAPAADPGRAAGGARAARARRRRLPRRRARRAGPPGAGRHRRARAGLRGLGRGRPRPCAGAAPGGARLEPGRRASATCCVGRWSASSPSSGRTTRWRASTAAVWPPR